MPSARRGMATRTKGHAGGSRSWSAKLLKEADGFAEWELAQRPEARIINRFAVILTYMLMALKLARSLALLWSTVVLLGGFVTALKRKDFWYLTFIAFMQAAGLINAIGASQFKHFLMWMISLLQKMRGQSLFKGFMYMIGFAIFTPVVYLATYGPIVCFLLSFGCLRQQDYGSDDGDSSKANLKPALNLFYSLSLVQGAIFMLILIFGNISSLYVQVFISNHGFSREVIIGYINETNLRCMNNPASMKHWNLITYGASLLDSELPDDFVLGARAINMLIEQEKPIKWFLIRSPRHRIQKLIGALSWRSPADREIRVLASRIVAHLAGDLRLPQFPGALESISSLLDTSYDNRSDQEILNLPSRSNQKRRTRGCLLFTLIRKYWAWKNGNMQDTKQQEKGTNEDLILQGLRILKNLAHDQHNCSEISNTRVLISEITGPINSDKLIEDIGISVAWIKMVDLSLRVVARLMQAPGDTGINMRHKIAGSSKTIENLEAILGLEGDSSILVLQTHTIEVLAQLFSDESTTMSRETIDIFIKGALHIFLTDKWMEDYFQDKRKKIVDETTSQLVKDDKGPSFWEELFPWEELSPSLLEKKDKKRRNALVEKKMKEAQETAWQHKQMAGEALSMLSMGSRSNSQVIMSLTGCGDVIHCLTEFLNSKNKTIECSISATETLKTDIKTRCRISAADILKHLCAHSTVDNESVKKTLLKKVLEELLNTERKTESKSGGNSRNASAGNDEENPPPLGSDQQELSTRRSLQQPQERILQAALLSLYATIREKWTNVGDFASVVVQLVAYKDLVRNLKAVVEENSYATPACLAILKITCGVVILLMQHNQYLDVIKEEKIIEALSEASEAMSMLESRMLFAGVDHDCYGVPVKPLSSVLVKQAGELLIAKVPELANNIPA